MGRQPPEKRFFNTTCGELVNIKNILLYVILGPWIYLLLIVTFMLKERYITHHFYQTNWITTDSKSGAIKGNVSINRLEIRGNGRQHWHNPRLQTRGISPTTLVIEGEHIPWDFLVEGTVHFIRKTNRSLKTQDSQQKTETPNSHYGITVSCRITKTLLTFGISMLDYT